jgi:hypothetical protein
MGEDTNNPQWIFDSSDDFQGIGAVGAQFYVDVADPFERLAQPN